MSKSQYTELEWQIKGQKLLNTAHDADKNAEMTRKLAKNTNIKFAVTIICTVITTAITVWGGFSAISVIATLVSLVVLIFHCFRRWQVQKLAGISKWDQSMPYFASKAWEEYNLWLLADQFRSDSK